MSEWITEALCRGPIRVDDSANPESLAAEFRERLEALLASHGQEPTAEGWRDLAVALALQYEPAFQIETPADREQIGGRPATMRTFVIRSKVRAEMRRGRNQTQAAKIVAREMGLAAGSVNNAMSRKAAAPDQFNRAQYEWKAHAALSTAASDLSSQE